MSTMWKNTPKLCKINLFEHVMLPEILAVGGRGGGGGGVKPIQKLMWKTTRNYRWIISKHIDHPIYLERENCVVVFEHFMNGQLVIRLLLCFCLTLNINMEHPPPPPQKLALVMELALIDILSQYPDLVCPYLQLCSSVGTIPFA